MLNFTKYVFHFRCVQLSNLTAYFIISTLSFAIVYVDLVSLKLALTFSQNRRNMFLSKFVLLSLQDIIVPQDQDT